MESLTAMRTFVRVVDAGSFSEAGRQLDMAPSSVSRQINDLEEELTVRLFQRTTRKLSLTEAGAADRARRTAASGGTARRSRVPNRIASRTPGLAPL